ncbi:sensor histidine kinase [Sphingomonas gilva]|uniref:histidine kinase n=1 Tax=Sphingomonas gilva TaxID=2305907 RepID=A0A396RJS6_9SPHN|nr:HAMP domain-containing sensor histidine kinase [Sphingomonas gilva]RHW16249.1 sensor histidine kinase [Sphingomonas gilva]
MPAPDIIADIAPYRVDDRVRTAILGLSGDATARETAWRQMIDLLCQPSLAAADADMLVDAVMRVHASIPVDGRREAARVAAFGAPPPALVVLLANDRPVVAADLLATVRLGKEAWGEVLPQLSPVARGILRARRDLDPDVAVALASFGPVDFVLPGSTVAEAGDAGLTRIADLVARIEAFRQTRQPPTPPVTVEPLAEFRFETDAAGVVRWVDAADRAALIGVGLTEPAEGAGPGVDAGAMAAIRRRSAFRDCRLTVASDTPAGGDWRISAAPVFDDATGRLAGYRGVARRPTPHQRAEAMAAPSLAPDSLRQLVHELRTPLNAIGGFAELIERQLMGPVAAPYRAIAGEIGGNASRLMGAIDDLDAAARIDGRSLDLVAESVALDRIVGDALARYRPFVAERGALLIESIDAPVSVEADPRAVERMVGRLLGAVLPIAEAGEALHLALAMQDGWARLTLDRPAAFDADHGDDDSALLLGFDFSIRLVGGLAHAMGGRLAVEGPRLTLSLPAAATRSAEDGRG